MDRALMFIGRHLRLYIAASALALTIPGPARAQTGTGYRVDHGIAIYYGVIPAEMLRGHPSQHPEATMHRGIPSSPHAYHVMVALFDASSLQRITGADVTANVAEVGLAGEEKKLEKFTIADAVTYGNYFEMRPKTRYRVSITVNTPRSSNAARVEFDAKD
jgi:hypothetical protein